ncbi:hypothetical protein SPPV_43 [Sheeppox virus]|uniref:Telomere mismatch binding protein n=2 Tax=Sheeppox virus TaxID=10266 RepID=A0A3F2YKK4_SHEVT|nr:hypothetical protein SPPV_43 [Sheeppox virus]AOE46408.1 hypothetical protein SPPV-GH_43 [Sheeppox virus]AOE46557.1 hypothetical protein SPPV-GL_43 [Sheeppox virus]AVI09543.1 hypothetical protein [Sheeppox virus]QEJ79939.1 telomere mismatch binding protein [Sheeppox virus]QEJ80088.1 telomere mismatch binding protein [Sheeppox virus]
MNNFIKHVSYKISKPNKKLSKKLDDEIKLKECIISFNFENFYYSNEILFNKPTNSLDDVNKSWLIMESFKYEKYVIMGLINILKKKSYITDFFFIPIGWIVGNNINNDDNIDNNHVVIKITIENNKSFQPLSNKIKDFLSHYDIFDLLIIQKEKELNILSFKTPNNFPSVVISLFPFDVTSIIIVLFFGIFDDSYCGLSYITNKDNLNYVIEVLKPISSEINILSDEITRFVSIKLFNNELNKNKKFPEEKIFFICEFIKIFEKTKFEEPKSVIHTNITTFIPKKMISLIDLPSNVEIRTLSNNGIDYITHINDKKLSTILIITKDNFLKNVSFSGTFKKENIIWKGYYTYRIIESTFDVPKLKISPNGKKRYITCKSAFNNSTFTTRSGQYIV